jgi:hypothetical protein
MNSLIMVCESPRLPVLPLPLPFGFVFRLTNGGLHARQPLLLKLV